MSSSIPSWQILTAHAQSFRGARDLAFCLKVPLDSLLVWANSEGSGETARMRRLAWTFAARIGDKYQIRLTRSICQYPLVSHNFDCWVSLRKYSLGTYTSVQSLKHILYTQSFILFWFFLCVSKLKWDARFYLLSLTITLVGLCCLAEPTVRLCVFRVVLKTGMWICVQWRMFEPSGALFSSDRSGAMVLMLFEFCAGCNRQHSLFLWFCNCHLCLFCSVLLGARAYFSLRFSVLFLGVRWWLRSLTVTFPEDLFRICGQDEKFDCISPWSLPLHLLN